MFSCKCGFYQSEFKSLIAQHNVCPRCYTELSDCEDEFKPKYKSKYNAIFHNGFKNPSSVNYMTMRRKNIK